MNRQYVAIMAGGDSKRVLLVEDSTDDREMYEQFLSAHGYWVRVVGDAEAAIAIALNTAFDVIVMDIGLPRMDGIEAVTVLRNYAKTKHVPIITLSARTGAEVRETAIEAGANLALEKPCSPEDLEATMRVLVQRGRFNDLRK